MESLRIKQYGRWLPADVQTPISLYLGLVGDDPGILLESAEVDGRLGRYSLIAWDFRLIMEPVDGKLRLTCTDDRLKGLMEYDGMDFLDGIQAITSTVKLEADQALGDLPSLTHGIYGVLGYSIGGMLEPKLAKALPPEDAEARMVLPGKVVLFDHTRHRCCYLCLDQDAPLSMRPLDLTEQKSEPNVGEITASPEREEYKQGVLEAKRLITEGEAIQIVLSTRFSCPSDEDPFSIYRRLRQANPSPFMFYMRFGENDTVLGSSPEMLIRCEAGRLEVRPIAGTRVRGADEEEDRALAEDLLADPKERAEHVMLVDLGRNDLGRISKPGAVTVEKFMQVERFSHVMHLTSYVTGELAEGLDAIDVLRAGFPAGTVSGAPKIRAMEIIADIEQRARGPYAGAIGWIGLDGGEEVNLDTGICIRSMWVRNGVVSWQAGAGLVYDSDPEKEWQECNNKARVLREVITAKETGDVFADR